MQNESDYSFARVHLSPDEYILWKGKPAVKPLLSKSDIFMIPFSILWCGFAFFWEITAIAGNAPFFFCLWGIPFMCIGLYFVFGRFLYTAYIRKRTLYVITNRKIIRLRGKRVDFLAASTMPPAHCIANTDGSGTIRFIAPNPHYRNTYNFSFYSTGMDQGIFALENISNLAQVQHAIDSMEK